MISKKPKLIFALILVYAASFISMLASPLVEAQIGFPGSPTTGPSTVAPSTPTSPTPSAPTSGGGGSSRGEEFVFYMNASEEDAVVKAIDGGQITSTVNPLSQTAIYSRGGQFGNTPIQFRYTSQVGNNFYYEVSYYCNGSGDTSRTKSDEFPSEIKVQVAAPLTKSFVQSGTAAGAGAAYGQLRAQFSSPNADEIRVKKCLPNNLPATVYVASFKHLTASSQSGWGTLQTTAVAQAAENGGGTGDSPDSNPDCDATITNPLSWIICPIIDLGANFTDAVFTTFVRPLLEDIPVGSDPSDGGYRAWQGFRALGNIVLVGCLLAIVYAQARGEK